MKNYEDGVIGCPLEIIILREKHPGHVLFCISKRTFCKLWAASIVVFFSTSQIKSSQISFPKFQIVKFHFSSGLLIKAHYTDSLWDLNWTSCRSDNVHLGNTCKKDK